MGIVNIHRKGGWILKKENYFPGGSKNKNENNARSLLKSMIWDWWLQTANDKNRKNK